MIINKNSSNESEMEQKRNNTKENMVNFTKKRILQNKRVIINKW